MHQLEEKLNDLFVKNAPFQVPENGRKGIVGVMPWVALVGGVLMLLAAWGLYQAAVAVSYWADWANTLGSAYGAPYTPSSLSFFVWISLALIVVEAVMFFIAFPALKAHQKKGWNLLFLVTLLNAAQAVLQMFGYSSPGSLIFSLLGSVVGLYLLFQIRGYYTGAAPATPGAGTTTMNVPKETPPSTTPPATPPSETPPSETKQE
jgi:hypothetical protein